ncbi:MAG: hypothetical protein AB7U75_22330 [Hyphomicrobiaceae bacterium]
MHVVESISAAATYTDHAAAKREAERLQTYGLKGAVLARRNGSTGYVVTISNDDASKFLGFVGEGL